MIEPNEQHRTEEKCYIQTSNGDSFFNCLIYFQRQAFSTILLCFRFNTYRAET